MRLEFFQQQMERLRKVYSPASLNEERIKVMWDRFKLVDDSQFECAVNHLIGEFTTPSLPALSRFAEAIAMFSPSSRIGGPSNQEVAPNPNAARLAKEYGGNIIRMLRGVGHPLPYDQEEREEVEWK